MFTEPVLVSMHTWTFRGAIIGPQEAAEGLLKHHILSGTRNCLIDPKALKKSNKIPIYYLHQIKCQIFSGLFFIILNIKHPFLSVYRIK